ncbi:IQ motif and ankyrin repeat domain-containing protein 1-like isoform X2 [Hydractinia symbiolongicarpus]|uniref:IQ motif and ankyrin repeat domain-containing protein 1-like isoform X2 n=1 Tax=Hydractinia symbiolongicarpus TaxID=13093 RepID=UPI00254BD41E|nr:IQ motif and ankyrin repeat domain-containing protein 1-like isoform X2 [Hydractinia symbiolongicarpus]
MAPKKNPRAPGGTLSTKKTSTSSTNNKNKTSVAKRGTQQKNNVAAKEKHLAKINSKEIDVKTTKKKPKTQEDVAAIKIQRQYKCFLARRKLLKLKNEKQEYEDMIEQIQKKAWLDIIEQQRKEDEEKRLKEEEERRKRRQELKWRKDILTAAFDGELDEIKKILELVEENCKTSSLTGPALQNSIQRYRMSLIECKDANDNCALSEASAGGDPGTVLFFIQNGASINSIGQHHRTPIYRAAFAGHFDVVKTLLEHGGDPRVLDSDGVTAAQIAALPEIRQFIEEWDVSHTDVLLEKLEKENELRKAEQHRMQKEEQDRIQMTSDRLEKEFSNKQKVLQRAYQELNKRINEHDKCTAKGYERTDVTLKAIHAAEENLLKAQREEKACREELSKYKSDIRDQCIAEGDDSRCVKCNIKELDDVIMRDVGDKIKESKKWPLLIDTSNQAATFLRYRDTNYVNVLSPKDMENESLRKALIGAIRYGKALVLDMMEINLLKFIEERLYEIEENLFHSLLNGTILKNEKYLSLVRKDDGVDYLRESFTEIRIRRFSLIIVTKMWQVPDEWLDMFYGIKIVTPSVS